MASRKRVLSLRCPTCRKLVLGSETEFPFCSERCRLIDLGKWASGGYVVSSPIFDPDELEQQPGREAKGGRDSADSDHPRH